MIYSAGETHNIDATFLAWLLAGFGHPRGVRARRRVLQVAAGAAAGRAAVPAVRAGDRFPDGRSAPEQAALAEVQAGARGGGRDAGGRAAARPVRRRGGRADAAGAHPRRGEPLLAGRSGAGGVRATSGSRSSELRASYAAQGITPDRDIIAYCNSATEASHVYFTLRYLLGLSAGADLRGLVDRVGGAEELPIEGGSGQTSAVALLSRA